MDKGHNRLHSPLPNISKIADLAEVRQRVNTLLVHWC